MAIGRKGRRQKIVCTFYLQSGLGRCTNQGIWDMGKRGLLSWFFGDGGGHDVIGSASCPLILKPERERECVCVVCMCVNETAVKCVVIIIHLTIFRTL